ncbi:MAG TPA: hypothetical protein VN737_09380 [Bryobacteraceae bacterium]|nr:hypothetical protein [Bryobacteraceae bacterium]
MDWTHSASAVLAAFLASLVEFVEALTIVLAVGITRGWRSALMGALAGAIILGVLVVVLGPSLGAIPLSSLQVVIGILLLLFGTRWLRKAILRAAGVLALHDEEKIYAREIRSLTPASASRARMLDPVAFAASLKAVFIEGLEVVFIVTAVGATGHMLLPASAGALGAGVLVMVLGVVLHRPLTRIPENTLKLSVGILLSAFGIFWIGEGLGYEWIGQDWTVIALIAGFLVVALAAIRIANSRHSGVLRPQ